MLPAPPAFVTGVRVEHSELRTLHKMRIEAIRESTARYSLDGPRLLDPRAGETCEMQAHGRDRKGSLLAEIIVRLPAHGQTYRRRIRLVRDRQTDVRLRVGVARELRDTHT